MLLDGWGWIAFAVYSVGMPLGALGLWLVHRRSIRDIKLARIPESIPMLVKGFAVALLIPAGIFALIVSAGRVDVVRSNLDIALLITSVILPQILVAAAEEFAFRGVTQPLLATQIGTRRALAVTAILFGIFHLPNALYNDIPMPLIPLTIGTLAIMGWVFGAAFLQTGNRLALPIALHWGWNIASFGIEPLFDYEFSGAAWLIGVPGWFPESGLIGGIGLLLLSIFVTRITASTTTSE